MQISSKDCFLTCLCTVHKTNRQTPFWWCWKLFFDFFLQFPSFLATLQIFTHSHTCIVQLSLRLLNIYNIPFLETPLLLTDSYRHSITLCFSSCLLFRLLALAPRSSPVLLFLFQVVEVSSPLEAKVVTSTRSRAFY